MGTRPFILSTVLLVSLVVFSILSWRVETSITHFLPNDADKELLQVSRELTDSTLTKSMVFSIQAGDESSTIAAAKTWIEGIEKLKEVAWVQSGTNKELESDYYKLYFPRRFHFSPIDETERMQSSLRQAAIELKNKLASPTGSMIRPLVPRDPFLLFSTKLRTLGQAKLAGLEAKSGQLVSTDGFAVIFVGLKHSPFKGAAQAPFLGELAELEQSLRRQYGDSFLLETSGINRFAVASEARIRADITRISVLSTAAVALLFLVLFRSFATMLLALLPIAAGMVTAAAVSLALFGQIHGLTLAFGASLIGVAMDYPIHLINSYALGEGKTHNTPTTPYRTLRLVWPGLLLGSVTTVAGLSGLAWTTFPGIRELATFAAVGVLAALFSTRWQLTPCLEAIHSRRTSNGHGHQPTPAQLWVVRLIGSIYQRFQSNAQLRRLPLAVAFLVCAVGLPQIEWEDNLAALNPALPDLVEEEERVRARVGGMDTSVLIVSLGKSEAEALETNDGVAQVLIHAKQRGDLLGFHSLSTFLNSPKTQMQRANAWRTAGFLSRFEQAFQDEGFRPDSFKEMADDIRNLDSQAPLSLEDLENTSLASLTRSFHTKIGPRSAIMTYLRGVQKPELLAQQIADIPGAHYIDQTQLLSSSYASYRDNTIQLIAVGFVVIGLIVFARYRSLRLTAAALCPTLLAVATCSALLGIFGQPVGLLHILGLLLVMSMGVDYGVFLVETQHVSELNPLGSKNNLANTLSSLAIACLSTVFSFGLLSLSELPALSAMGTTIGVGVLFSLLFSPITLLVVGERKTK